MKIVKCSAYLNIHAVSDYVRSVFGPLVGEYVMVSDEVGDRLVSTGYWSEVETVSVKGKSKKKEAAEALQNRIEGEVS